MDADVVDVPGERLTGDALAPVLAAAGDRVAAVETCLATARTAAALVGAADHLDLICEPELSVVAFRRTGWEAPDYRTWSARLLAAGEGFVVPSTHDRRPMVRLCIVNPCTTGADIAFLVDSLR